MKHPRLLLAPLALALSLATPGLAQTPAQHDSAVKAAARTRALPLPTPRPLSFTTDEASWISLDIAPDAKTIVFDILDRLVREERRTVVIVTHDLALAERAHRRVHLVDGRIVADRAA